VLSRQGKSVRQGVLADELGIEGPSLVRLIDLLKAEGLVERREDPTDRRAKTLHLTALGETKVEEINRVLRRLRAALLKDIGSDELAVTFETLQRIERQTDRLYDARTVSEAD
jgi:MarR family transcriptional regulator, transcriptional regulator for hemolysin